MRLAVVIVLVLMLAARFELSIRSGPDSLRSAAADGGGFAIDLRMGGARTGLLR